MHPFHSHCRVQYKVAAMWLSLFIYQSLTYNPTILHIPTKAKITPAHTLLLQIPGAAAQPRFRLLLERVLESKHWIR